MHLEIYLVYTSSNWGLGGWGLTDCQFRSLTLAWAFLQKCTMKIEESNDLTYLFLRILQLSFYFLNSNSECIYMRVSMPGYKCVSVCCGMTI